MGTSIRMPGGCGWGALDECGGWWQAGLVLDRRAIRS